MERFYTFLLIGGYDLEKTLNKQSHSCKAFNLFLTFTKCITSIKKCLTNINCDDNVTSILGILRIFEETCPRPLKRRVYFLTIRQVMFSLPNDIVSSLFKLSCLVLIRFLPLLILPCSLKLPPFLNIFLKPVLPTS